MFDMPFLGSIVEFNTQTYQVSDYENRKDLHQAVEQLQVQSLESARVQTQSIEVLVTNINGTKNV